MWPWGHLAFAYTLYSSFVHLRYRLPPTWPGVALVALGSQAPDLVDKPLAWTFNILPTARSLGHSLLIGTVIVAVTVAVLRRLDLPGLPFALGYYSHIVGDSFRAVFDGRFHDLVFLVWPLLPLDAADKPTVGIVRYLLNARLEGTVLLELGLAGVVFAWWILDGAPGLAALWNALYRRVVPRAKN